MSAVSLLAMPNRSRSYIALRTPSAVRPDTTISSSVDIPLSGSASINVSAMLSSRFRYSLAISALDKRLSASSTELTLNEDGNTFTLFSSRVNRTASSSQETAVRTRVSSVAESLSKTFSSSSIRISPGVATTSPFNRFLRSSLRSARRTPWISCRVSLDRADIPNCRSMSSGEYIRMQCADLRSRPARPAS